MELDVIITCILFLFIETIRFCSPGNITDNDTFTLRIGIVTDDCEGWCNLTRKHRSTLKLDCTAPNEASIEVKWHYINSSDPYILIKQVAKIQTMDSDLIVVNIKSSYHRSLVGGILNKTFSTAIATATFANVDNGSLETVSRSALSRFICSVFLHLSWREVLIIYEEDFDQEITHLLDSLSVASIYSALVKLEKSTNDSQQRRSVIRQHVESLMQNGWQNIAVLCIRLCNFVLTENIHVVSENPYLRASIHTSHWLVFQTDEDVHTQDIQDILYDNVAIISLPKDIMNNAEDVDKSLEKAIYNAAYKAETSMPIDQHSTDNTAWKDKVINALLQDVANLSSPSPYCEVNTLMWSTEGLKRQLSPVGNISTRGESFLTSSIFPNSQFGFNGRELKVATIDWPPFVTKENGQFSGGMCIDILDQLANMLNFTYVLVEPSDRQFGNQLENGSFTGLVGLLERHEVDLIAAPLTVTYNREKVLDFIYPFYNEVLRIIQRKPTEKSRGLGNLLNPFNKSSHLFVFLCFGISLPTAAFLMSIFEKLFPNYRQRLDREDSHGLHTFCNAFWYLYGAMLMQGGHQMAESITGRLFLSSWWMFSITLIALYSGNLIAVLTVSVQTLDFDTLEDLVELDGYKWGLIGGTAYNDMLEYSDVDIHMRFWSGVKSFNESDPSVLDVDTRNHVLKALNGHYAFLSEETTVQEYLREHCDLALTTDQLFPSQFAFALQNNSLFGKLFSKKMIEIHESGLLEHWKNKVSTQFTTCEKKVFRENKPIEFQDLEILFYLIGFGVVFAAIALALECFRQKYKLQTAYRKTLRTSTKDSVTKNSENCQAVNNTKRNTEKTCISIVDVPKENMETNIQDESYISPDLLL